MLRKILTISTTLSNTTVFNIANKLQNWFLNDYIENDKHQVIIINPQTPLQHLKQINEKDNTSDKNAVNKHCIHS